MKVAGWKKRIFLIVLYMLVIHCGFLFFLFTARSNAFSLDFNNRNTIRQPRPLNITTNDLQQNHQPARGTLRLSFDPDGQPRPVPVVRAQPPPLQDRTRYIYFH